MKIINLYLSGQIRTLYECASKNIQKIKETNPDAKIHVYYSFWNSTERLLNRKEKYGSPDGDWHVKSDLHLRTVLTKSVDKF